MIIVWLLNVYGLLCDHVDRVVFVFMKVVFDGCVLCVDGEEYIFDFIFVDDVVRGLLLFVILFDEIVTFLSFIYLVIGVLIIFGQFVRVVIGIVGIIFEIC